MIEGMYYKSYYGSILVILQVENVITTLSLLPCIFRPSTLLHPLPSALSVCSLHFRRVQVVAAYWNWNITLFYRTDEVYTLLILYSM